MSTSLLIDATRIEALRRAGAAGYAALLAVHGSPAERTKLAQEAQAAAAIAEELSTPSGAATALSVLAGQLPPEGWGASWHPNPTRRSNYRAPAVDRVAGIAVLELAERNESSAPRGAYGAIELIATAAGGYELRTARTAAGAFLVPGDARGQGKVIMLASAPRAADSVVLPLQATTGPQRYPLASAPPSPCFISIVDKVDGRTILTAELRKLAAPQEAR